MKPSTSKTLWQIIEETLADQHFTPKDIREVRTDIENLIRARATTSLLELLTPAQRNELKEKLVSKTAEEQQQQTIDFLRQAFPEDSFTRQTEQSTKVVMEEYLQFLLTKLSNQPKAQLLQSLISQLAT